MILLGGGQGTATAPMNTSAVLLRQMNAKEIFDPVCCFATDTIMRWRTKKPWQI